METTSELDEYLFLETYYQSSGCTTKINENSTKIKLLLNELENQIHTNSLTTKTVKQLQEEYTFIHTQNEGVITIDEMENNKRFNHLKDDLKVSEKEIVHLHNDFIEDKHWNELGKMIEDIPDVNAQKRIVLDMNVMNDYCQRDEKEILRERIKELERENNELKKKLFDIKIMYQKAQKSLISKSPFYHDVVVKSEDEK